MRRKEYLIANRIVTGWTQEQPLHFAYSPPVGGDWFGGAGGKDGFRAIYAASVYKWSFGETSG